MTEICRRINLQLVASSSSIEVVSLKKAFVALKISSEDCTSSLRDWIPQAKGCTNEFFVPIMEWTD
jgi:hypothetical protein